jgi:hypothetical protein
MANGYVAITNGVKMIKYRYLSSNSEVDRVGWTILHHIIEKTIDAYVDDSKDNYRCPYTKLERISTFCEYGYLYDEKTGILKIYRRGEFIYNVDATIEEREKYLFFFKNQKKITDAYTYHWEKLSFDRNKLTRNVVEALNLADMKELVNKYDKYKDDMFILDVNDIEIWNLVNDIKTWTFSNAPRKTQYINYRWTLYMSKYSVVFYVFQNIENDLWDIMIELPYDRAMIASGYKCVSMAADKIREIVHENPKQLMMMAKIMKILETHYNKKEYHELESLIVSLPDLWEIEPWYTACDQFTIDNIKDFYSRQM